MERTRNKRIGLTQTLSITLNSKRNSNSLENFLRVVLLMLVMILPISISAESVANIQNGSFASVHQNKLYSVDGNTGKVTLLVTIPDTIEGVDTNASTVGINSLAINRADGLLYFANHLRDDNNRALFAYNMRTGDFSVLESDMGTRGVTFQGRGMGSGGAFFEPDDRRLYFGIEDDLVDSPYDSYVYSIAVDGNGELSGNVSIELKSLMDWGDFAVSGNTLYSGNSVRDVDTGERTTHYMVWDLGTLQSEGDENKTVDELKDFGQIGSDLSGNYYFVTGNTAVFAPIDLATGDQGSSKTMTLDGNTTLNKGSYDAAGIIPYDSSIGDIVWSDSNGNGILDTGEVGIPNVTIEIYDDINGDGVIDNGGDYNNTDRLLAIDITDINGFYKFTGLIPGNYIIKLTDTNGVLSGGTLSTVGTTIQTATIIKSLEFVDSVDFGYLLPDNDSDGIADIIDLDNDNDGILDINEGFCQSAYVDLHNGTIEITRSEYNISSIKNYITMQTPEGDTSPLAPDEFMVAWDEQGGQANFNYTFPNPVKMYVDAAGQFTVTFYYYDNIGNKTGEYNSGPLKFNLITTDATLYASVDLNTTQIDQLDAGHWIPLTFTYPVPAESIVTLTGFSTSMEYNGQGYGGTFNSNTTEVYATAVEQIIACSGHKDSDGDNVPDYLDLDSDNDGIPDNVEGQTTADYEPISGTVDANGTYASVYGLAGIIPVDTDEDNISDYLDLDTDNDGILDRNESGLTLINNVGFNGLDNNIEIDDTYIDVNGNINEPSNDLLESDNNSSDVDYRSLYINIPPVILDNNQTIIVSHTVILDLLAGGIDENNDTLSVTSINGEALTGTEQNITVPNGVVQIATDGTITFIPTSGYTGDVIFPFEVSNGTETIVAHVNITVVPDTDGDGIPNTIDLDDDNDGILDSVECTRVTHPMTFDDNGSTIPWVGQTEADVTIITDDPQYGPYEPGGAFASSVTASDGTMMNISKYFQVGTENDSNHYYDLVFDHPVPASELIFYIYDIDNDSSKLTVEITVDGGTATEEDFIGLGIIPSSASHPDAKYTSANIIKGDDAHTNQHIILKGNSLKTLTHIRFTSHIVGSYDAVVIALASVRCDTDTDGDGLFDYLDLDSDNDGIPDNVEGQTTANYEPISGTVDANGTYASVYGLAGIIPVDTDEDNISDYLDLDSDNDTLFDIEESGQGVANDGNGRTTVNVGSNGLANSVDTNDDYVDVNGKVNQPESDLSNASGDTSEVAYRELELVATDDTGKSINGSTGGESITNITLNDTLNAISFVLGTDVNITSVTNNTPLVVDLTSGKVTVPENTLAGTYIETYTICENSNSSNCEDANITVVVTSSSIAGTNDTNDTVNGSNGGVAIENITENDTLNGNPVTLGTDANITNVTNNTPLVIDPTTGAVTVPTQTEAGTYTETYTLCENLNPDNCVENNITITVNPAPIDAIDDDFTATPILSSLGGVAGDITPVGNDTLNGLDINGSLTTLTLLPSKSNLTAVTLEDNGTLSVDANTPAGTYNVAYKLCEVLNPTNCDDANVTVVVKAVAMIGSDDTNDTVNGSNGGVAIENITKNDTLNGNPVTLGTDANITHVTNNTPLIIDPTTGAVTVPTQTEAGTYTETYTLCENLNPDNCVENNITITVNPAPIDAIDDDFTATPILSSLGGVAGDITPVGNDTLNGLDINGSLTTLTLLPSKSNLTAVTLEVNGTLSVDANTPAGTYNVAYKLCEVLNPTNCDDANVTVVVKAVAIIGSDDTNDTVNGSNGGVAIENITENDTLNGNPVTLGTDANITHVTNNTPLVIDPTTGAVTVPTQTEAGTYTETYTLCENLNPDNCVENNITITVNPAPIDAIDDDFTTNPINGGTGGEIGDITPIGNDTLNGLDINGSLTTLTLLPSESNLTAVTLEGNGTLSLNPNTPAGVYNVAYKLCEVLNQTNCDDANVTVVVETNPTIGNEDNVTATTGKSVVIDVLSNDKDQEDDIDPTTVKIIDPTTGDSVTSLVVVNEGKWEVNTTNGEITFTPEDGFTGDPTPITYVVSDTTGNISEPVSVHVNYPQTAPVAVDDNLTAPITGQAITFNILNNDTDTENDINTTSVKLLGADENQELFIEDEGVWSINLTTGEVTFAPEEGFKGNPTPIKYTVSDKLGEVSNEATISIYYPQTPPIGVDDNQTAQSGETVSILVLNNDSDLEDDIDVTTVGIVHPLNKNLVSELSVPTEGVWSVDSSTGEITFVPEDGFTNDPTPIYYQVSDRLGNRSSETKVMIDYPQTATRAVADVKNGETGKAVTIDILANDIDDENDTVPSTVRLLDKEDNPVTQLVVPNEGTWSINSDTGEVTFTPLEGVTFDPTPVRYTVEDKTGQISLPVTITVNYPQTPVDAKEDTGEANTGEPITIDVLANDSDLEDDIDPTTVKILDRDGNSVTELTIANEGTWRVDPSSGAITFTPEDTFTGDPSMILYTVKDRTGEVSLPVKVTVNYPQTAPEVKDDRVEVEAGTTIVNVLENDWDAENDIDINSVKLVHPVNSTLVDTLEIPNEGTWSVDRENGTVTFTPLDSFTGNPTPISYRVSDTTKEQSLPATVTIIYPQPMALENDIVNNVTSGSSVSIHVLDNDTIKNVVVETLQITGTQNPGDSLVVSGEGVWSIENDVIIFTPEEGFELDPTDITYSVEDINGKRDTKATVTVNYKGKVRPDKKVTDLSLPVTVNVLFNDSGNLNPASVEIVLPEGFKETHPNAILSSDGKELIVPNQGKWVVNSDGTITYTTEENAPIIDPTPISYKVYDKNGNELETDALIILKNQKIAGVSDTENTGCVTCQEYDDSSVPTLNYIGLGLVGLLTTILGLFLFRKEKYTI